jgi:dimeric dUTPase (all-alpha-NTP-PPase superfamily)
MNNLNIIIDELSIKQAELDAKVCERFNIQHRDYIQETILALKVEIAELANETRCFKFWSEKPAADKGTILEEYADCVHFTLSIGVMSNLLIENDIGRRLYSLPAVKVEELIKEHGPQYRNELTIIFNRLYTDLAALDSGVTFKNYIKLLQSILNLGFALGFDEVDIYQGYIRKNKINLERQEAGY